jgi:hypothetical protein
MTDDTVVRLHNEMGCLADQIERALDRVDDSDAAKIDLCLYLAQARAKFPSNIEFGHWWDQQRFKDRLGHQDRAAAIAMGEHPDDLRRVMAATERRSLQTIYSEEFRLTRFSKMPEPEVGDAPEPTPEPKKKRKRGQAKRSKLTRPIREKIVALTDLGLPQREIVDTINADLPKAERISVQIVKTVQAERAAVAEALAEEQALPPVDPATLSLTAKQQLEVCKRRVEKDAQQALAARMAQIDTEVHQKVLAATAERLAMLKASQAEAIGERDLYRRLTNEFKPIYTMLEFRKLQAITHSDKWAGGRPPTKEMLDEAFNLITSKQFQLTKVK